MHEIDHRVLHAFAQTEIAALAPAADGIAARLEESAQGTRGDIGRDEAGQYQHWMPVAAWREAEQRKRSDKGT